MKLLLIISFVLLKGTCYSQDEIKYSIYVGKVSGVSKNQFIKQVTPYDKSRDSLLGKMPITESRNIIEIRLYESPSATAAEACTILYYDTIFALKRISKVYNGWEENYIDTVIYPLLEKPDSVFKKIVENGLFNLPRYSQVDTARMILTNNGLVRYKALCGVLDGTSYTIFYKVGNRFGQIYFSSDEKATLNCFPDDDVIRRKSNIVSLLRSGVTLVKKR